MSNQRLLETNFSTKYPPGSKGWFQEALSTFLDPSRSTLELSQWVYEISSVDAPRLYNFEETLWDPIKYATEILGWTPWKGLGDDRPGQVEILDSYILGMRQLVERRQFTRGELKRSDLQWWNPSEPIKNKIAVDAGHSVGKTKLASLIVNHFLDHFKPSIIYTYAPTQTQIHDLLWKEIKVDRRGKGLPGQINDLEIKIDDNHFARGRATRNLNDRGLERSHGQHNDYLLFVIDEAEGVERFVWDSIEAMSAGGIVFVLSLRNPRTRTSYAHKFRSARGVKPFRISCLWHPNVLSGKEIIPNSVTRDWVEEMLEKYCEPVAEHNPTKGTFELPWRPGEVFLPVSPMWFWRVEGRPTTLNSDDTLISFSVLESAVSREEELDLEEPHKLRLGVDVARRGSDKGTIYARRRGTIWKVSEILAGDGYDYAMIIKDFLVSQKDRGVTDVQIRVDETGVGASVVDFLSRDFDLPQMFPNFLVIPVNFNETPDDPQLYYDRVTELYGLCAEALLTWKVLDPPETLYDDLCSRRVSYGKLRGFDVKRLEPKDHFKARFNRSPDEGDGFVLCLAPDYIFSVASNFTRMPLTVQYTHPYER